MSPNIHKQDWRTDYHKPEPGPRPRLSREDVERARRDYEADEAQERAQKRLAMFIAACVLFLVWFTLTPSGQALATWIEGGQ